MLPEINRAKCCGYGICNEICPTVFKLDDSGFAYVHGPVSDEDRAAVLEAVEACPEEAITAVEAAESPAA